MSGSPTPSRNEATADQFSGFDRLAVGDHVELFGGTTGVLVDVRLERHTIYDGSEVVVAAVLTLDRPVWQPGRIVRRVRKHSHDVRLAYAVGPDRHIGWKVSPR